MIAIQTFLTLNPPVAGHSHTLITSLGLPLCFQPDGGISDSSSESDEEADIHSIPLVPELQRDSLHRWFEMRATWDLLTRPDGLSVRALRNLFVQAHGEPSPMWFSVIVDSGWFELFAPTRLPLAPLVLEAEGAIFTCLERVAHVRIVDCTRPGPLGNPFPVGEDQDVAVVCSACDELMLSGGSAAATPLRIDESYLPKVADERREAQLCDLASYIGHGGGIHLRCSASCAARRRRDPDALCHIFGIAVAIRARVRLALRRPAASFPASLAESSYHPSRLASLSQATSVRLENSRWHVKRAPLPVDLHLRDVEAQPAPSLVAAVSQAPQPQRCCPTSMVDRKGSWRLCHDLSWPHPGTVDGVDSPNVEDAPVMLVTFVRISHLGRSASIMSLSGLPILFWKFDLSKAYKRSGQQSAGLWRRTTWSEFGSQTMERVPFGGADGPSFFTRQTNFMIFIIRRELEYADQSYPPRDPRVVAYQLARLEAARSVAAGQSTSDEREWLILSFIMCFIDDFGACSIADLLFRIDGSPVRDAAGIQQHRAWLHWEVAILTVRRLGHILELDDPSKAVSPSRQMVLIGVRLDADRLEFELDPLKRSSYADSLTLWLQKGTLPVARLTSLAFKMLVVCECYPLARQWLHPIFRSLRGQRQRPVILNDEPEVDHVLRRFLDLLQSDARIAVPMAARESFPFADIDALLVYFSDASGDDTYLLSLSPELSPGHLPRKSPGFGFWAVRGTRLLYVWGLFTPEEVRALSINALELVTMLWAEITLSPALPQVSHVLAFTDNTAGEWTARRETPQAIAMQLLAERRAEFLARSSLFVRVGRVASADNRWADMLSRQQADEVIAEATALGLTCERLHIPEHARNLSWLIARVLA